MMPALQSHPPDHDEFENAFRNLVEAAPYGMIMTDARGVIVLANAAMETVFGHKRADMIGQSMEMLLPHRYRALHTRERAAYQKDAQTRPMGAGREFTGLHKDGTEIQVEIGLNPVQWNGERMTVAAIVDISERKAMELELKQANAHLEEFSYVASHDLKAPLRSIADLVSWIAEDLPPDAKPSIPMNLDRIRIRVARLEQIIGDLLTYAKAGRASAELTTIDAKALMEDVIEVQGAPPEFEIIVRSNVAPFKAARTPIETVLRNLLSNAIKHHDRAQGRIVLSANEEDAFAVFSVSDDGPGIPQAAHDRIFRLFQTLSPSSAKGTGIGLAVCKRLVEAHGGYMTIESPGAERGTTFRFWWPRFVRKGHDEQA
jgi:PAS domain S-box-containing protein